MSLIRYILQDVILIHVKTMEHALGKAIVIDVFVWTVLWVIIVKVTMSNAFLFEIKLLLY